MKTFELIAPCHFGLEAVLKREIIDFLILFFSQKINSIFLY